MLQRIVLWIIHLPHLLVDVGKGLLSVSRLKEYAKKPFVCPNCGSTFFRKWYHLWFNRENTLIMIEKAKLKCPRCKQTDLCKWVSDYTES